MKSIARFFLSQSGFESEVSVGENKNRIACVMLNVSSETGISRSLFLVVGIKRRKLIRIPFFNLQHFNISVFVLIFYRFVLHRIVLVFSLFLLRRRHRCRRFTIVV